MSQNASLFQEQKTFLFASHRSLAKHSFFRRVIPAVVAAAHFAKHITFIKWGPLQAWQVRVHKHFWKFLVCKYLRALMLIQLFTLRNTRNIRNQQSYRRQSFVSCCTGRLRWLRSQYIGRRLTIVVFVLLDSCFIPPWIIPSSFGALATRAFWVQVRVQDAWGVVPIQLAEMSHVPFMPPSLASPISSGIWHRLLAFR